MNKKYVVQEKLKSLHKGSTSFYWNDVYKNMDLNSSIEMYEAFSKGSTREYRIVTRSDTVIYPSDYDDSIEHY